MGRASSAVCSAIVLAAVLGAAVTGVARAASGGPDGELRRVVEEMDRLWFGNRCTARVSMEVKTANYSRTLRMTYWVEGKTSTLILINSPDREKGTATLKIGRDVYNYLPKIDRTVKVSAALLSGSWMGSHFTNDDLVKATRLADDSNSKLLSEKTEKGKTLWQVEFIPHPGVAVPWSRIVMGINKTDMLPLGQEFFDEKGKLVRAISYREAKKLGGRVVPSVVRVTPADKPEEYTELVYQEIDREVKFDGEFFSLGRLKSL